MSVRSRLLASCLMHIRLSGFSTTSLYGSMCMTTVVDPCHSKKQPMQHNAVAHGKHPCVHHKPNMQCHAQEKVHKAITEALLYRPRGQQLVQQVATGLPILFQGG